MRRGLLLAALLAVWGARTASAQNPTYTPDGVVNASDYSPGPFAPNSVLTVFGSNLSWYTQALAATDIVNNTLPTSLGGVEVYVDNWPAPLIYVSPSQINFIIPGNEIDGAVSLRVVRQGMTGPTVTVQLVDAAPALFVSNGLVIATDQFGTLLTQNAPARAGQVVVIYATGLGKSLPNPAPGVIPQSPDPIAGWSSMQVLLNGLPVDPKLVWYAGVTPGFGGLYQINVTLPANTPPNPEIRIAVAGQASLEGLLLPVQ